MIIKQKWNKSLFFFLFSSLIIWLLLPFSSFVFGVNTTNIITYLTINNSPPYYKDISFFYYNGSNNVSSSTFNLIPGGYTKLYCNVTVADYQGYDDIIAVNATLYFILNESSDSDEDNVHYSNASCINVSNIDGYTTFFYCAFDVKFHANNGTWVCNSSALDMGNATGTEINTSTINPLIAINVTGNITYGNVSVYEYSNEQNKNVSNIGNRPINISLRGFGGQDEGLYAGLSMVCDVGNISIEHEKFAIYSGYTGDQMLNLSASNQMLNYTISKQLTSTPTFNSTYWRIYVAKGLSGPAGDCNGTVVFTGSDAGI